MFRKTSPQLSLFSVNNIVPHALPADDWSNIYRDKVYPLIDEDKFQHLYNAEGGQPTKSIKTKVSLLIFMGMEQLNWRMTEFQFPRRLDWLNATQTGLGAGTIDHTTLFKFYQKLESDDTVRELFQELTLKFAEYCGTSLKKQRTDSFFIHGWLRLLSRYGLFKETIRVFLEDLRRQKPGLYEEIKDSLSRDYVEKDFDLTEKDKDKANRQIEKMAKDLYFLNMTFRNHNQVKHYPSFETLSTILSQQCEVKVKVQEEDQSECELVEIVIRDKPVGDEIISSPHNREARYVRKGKQKVCGQKGFVSESCEESNQTQFITDVEVTPATTSDSKELVHIHERLEECNMKPNEQYGDAGFVNGKTILESKEKDIQLEGPSSGRSQSFESFNSEDRPLDVADFEVKIEEEIEELTVISCPNKEKPLDQSRSKKTGKIIVHFDVSICSSCSLKERCPVKIGKRIATFTVDETSYTGALRHHKYMGDIAYRKQCGIRAGVEGLVSELTRAHGVRKSRHRTEIGTQLQLLFAAIGCNVKRFIRHGLNYGYLEVVTG